MRTAVIYARYSSDNQKERSIDDQISHCRQLAARHGYKVIDVYADRAISGESMFERDGLLALMNAAIARKFNAVFTESLSRLSRDEVDMPAIYKRLKYHEIKIIDTNGEVSEVHVGVGTIVNSQFIKNLRISVRRSFNGLVREGLVPGRIAYGYRRGGKACEREIDPAPAKIVRWIFEEYADGKPTRDIAADLTREKVPAPGNNRVWNSGTIGAMLANQLYIGKVVWNATTSIKNPDTGKRHFRRGQPEDLITTDVPELRIIPQKLWDRVEAVRSGRRSAKGRYGPRTYKFVNRDQLLIGLLTCAECGGTMIIGQNNADGSPRVICSQGHRTVGCTHRRSYCLKQLEATVMDGVKTKLTDRRVLLELTRSYHARWAERQKAARADRHATQKQLNRVTVQIDRVVTAISDSDDPVKALLDKLKQLEVQRASLTEKLRLIDRETNVVDLHPKAIDQFATAMEEMHKALTSGEDDVKQLAPFRAAFRNVFERIVVHPTEKRKPCEVTPHARLGAIMGLEIFPKMRQASEILAEQGGAASKISKISRT
ncbi:recombinase family protein [Bradyrhizobium sp. USDA 10063]